ncbi:MAG TPA: aminoglycoside phosphotransferase family protein [Anaerolineales bacterium]|nr:aminoglycoside phosphotransferase family protein [Anaerolineales bacterium]HLO33314.1 aminoglycoside phosphotransferase family protein [Anaerolineales bacterium]
MYDDVINIFQKYLPNQKWKVRRPHGGNKKRCYIVSNRKDKYFIKFDIPSEILKRLGEIQVAPKVLFSGEYGGQSFVIQEFINGHYPVDKAWMRDNVDELIRIISLYHQDQELFRQLAEIFPTDFRRHIGQDLEYLGERLSKIDTGLLQTAKMEEGFEQLKNMAQAFEAEPLVPIHNEPNPSNMLVLGKKLIFVDWDEITLSDPMRDIGVVLWWNFPPEHWPAFLEKCGIEITKGLLDKIYWFSARASFEIVLWHAEHHLDGQDFIEDFCAALNKQPNPKGYLEYY